MKKNVMFIMGLVAMLFIANGVFASNSSKVDNAKTAENVLEFADGMDEFDVKILRKEIKTLSIKERVRLGKIVHKQATDYRDGLSSVAPSKGVLYVLAVLIPPLAVGLKTDWQKPVIFNILWCCLGFLPGIIHAIIIVGR